MRIRGVSGQRSKDLWGFAKDFLSGTRRRIVGALVLVFFGAALESFSLILIIPLLSVVGSLDAGGSIWRGYILVVFDLLGAHSRLAQLGIILAIFAVGMVLRTVLLSQREIIVARINLEYLQRCHLRVINALARSKWNDVSRIRHSRVNHVMSENVYQAAAAASGLLSAIVALLTIAVQAAVAFAVDPILAMIALSAMAASAMIAIPLVRAASEFGEFSTDRHLEMLNDAGQFLGALKLSISHELQGSFAANFKNSLSRMAQAELGYVMAQNNVRARVTIVGLVAISATVLVGLGFLEVPEANLIAVLLIFARMNGPVAQLRTQLLDLVRYLPAFRELSKLEENLLKSSRVASQPYPPVMPALPADIRFENVQYNHFRQPGDDITSVGLTDLSIEIRAGSFVGIAGPSGAGKTTLVDLLVGLFEPQQGRITLNGEPIDLTSQQRWRESLSYVSQDSFMRNASVRENLCWGAFDVTDAKITAALRFFGIAEVVARLPNGIDTVIGERGSLISGGERQRLALARALLRKPRLLILDEATNAIDVSGERKILEGLVKLRGKTTVIMIAHRLESLCLCDKVAVIDGGRVVAEGSPSAMAARLADVTARAGFTATGRERP